MSHHRSLVSLDLIRQKRPLVLNITNLVAMDFCANALLAIGASPIMSIDMQEIEELAANASAVVINMGTLDEQWLQVAEKAWHSAVQHKKPVVFDPVGVGATKRRRDVAQYLLKKYPAAVIRGNAAEIFTLTTGEASGKGVDANASTTDMLATVQKNFPFTPSAIVISGATDYVLTSQKTYGVQNGHPLMAQVTATGCVATSVIGAFCAVEDDAGRAALQGMLLMGICGEIAAADAGGPGSFKSLFLDTLARADVSFGGRARLQENL